MKFAKFPLFLVLLFLVCVSLSIAAVAPPLHFNFADVNVKGALETDTYGVNDAGLITGDFVDKNGVQHGMILNHAKLVKFDNKACSGGIAGYAINATNQVAGWCTSATTSLPIGFVYSKGKYTSITGPSGATASEASGINDNGDVVGLYLDSASAQHGFILSGGKYTTVDVKGMSSTACWGINNSGLVTLYALDSSNDYHSYTTTDKGKTLTKWGYSGAGALGTVIHSPNNNGDIDGTYFDSSNGGHGVLWTGGKYYPFHDPKDNHSTRADGLNNSLTIVGRYSPPSGTNQGFLAHAK